MDMTCGRTPPYPVESEVAQGPWALFTSGSKSFNIPAFTGAYGFIPEENEARQLPAGAKGSRRALFPPSVPGAGRPYRRLPRRGSLARCPAHDYLQANICASVADTLNNAFPARSAGSRRRPPTCAWIDLRPLNVDDRALQQALIAEQKVAIMPGYTYGT